MEVRPATQQRTPWVIARAGSCCGREAAACRWFEAADTPGVTVVAATSAHWALWEHLLRAISEVRSTASRLVLTGIFAAGALFCMIRTSSRHPNCSESELRSPLP